MSWTVDVKATTEARIAQLPVSFAAAVEAALSRPAVQQPSWPDAEQAARVVGVLEGVPPIAVASEVDLLQGRLAAVARGEAFLCRAAIAPRPSWTTPRRGCEARSERCCRWPWF